MTKEEIVSRHWDKPHDDLYKHQLTCIEKAMQEYADQETQRLKAELEKVKAEKEELMKKAFEAGREKEYHYDKRGMDTGYYKKWDSFEQWINNNNNNLLTKHK